MVFSINILGYDHVGSSIGHLCLENKIPFNVYDGVGSKDIKEPRKYNYFKSLESIVGFSETEGTPVYFICAPTPGDSTGECDISIVDDVILGLSFYINRKSIIVIKNTVKPGTCRILSNKYANDKIDIVFCPEFVKETSVNKDMYNAKFALLGLDKKNESLSHKLSMLFTDVLYKHHSKKKWFKKQTAFSCVSRLYEHIELFKYTLNTYLAVKVWYFYEIYELCEKLNIDYQELKQLFPLDSRLGECGTIVPGSDDMRASGEKCISKESRSFLQLQQSFDIPNVILSEIIERNEHFRTL